MIQPLSGVTVISVEQAVAAPFASRQLADLGARVIKVERPEGDFARHYDRSVDGESSYFVWLNRNKESVVLNLKDDVDLEIVRRMIASADVFIQNLAPGAIERLGLGYDEARELNPALIYVSISGYGPDGPYCDKKAYDLLVACEAGLLSITGTPETPSRVGISVADIATGMYAFSGVITALLARGRTGEGDHLQIALLDALGEWMMQPYLYGRYSGSEVLRSGADHVTLAPYGPVETADGMVFLSVQNPGEWVRFCEIVLKNPALVSDERFADNDKRVARRAELSSVIAGALSKLSTESVVARLESAGVANAELRSISGFGEHPQLEARDRWQMVGTPAGEARVIRPPVVFRNIEYRAEPIPALGADSDRIRAEFGA